MNSGRVKTMVIDLEQTGGAATSTRASRTGRTFPASYISHHGAPCCDIAREWITGMDFSQLNAGHPLTGPRWLRKHFKWGPSKWPMHWCEAVQGEDARLRRARRIVARAYRRARRAQFSGAVHPRVQRRLDAALDAKRGARRAAARRGSAKASSITKAAPSR